MVTIISFSYDATKADYHENPFRLGVIKFLVDNQVFNIESHVATTIHFKTDAEKPLQTWEKMIGDKFGKDFNFILSIVPLYNPSGKNEEPAYLESGNEDYYLNFDKDVRKILKDRLVELEKLIESISKI